MHLELMRDKARTFPKIENPTSYTTARIWHCKYKTLEPLGAFGNLEQLEIATYPESSLEILEPLKKLRVLRILHPTKLTDLGALEQMDNLEELGLQTSIERALKGKPQVVLTLDPIGRMKRLRHLELTGVCGPDRSLKGIEKSRTLTSAWIGGLPQGEIDRFFAVTGAQRTAKWS